MDLEVPILDRPWTWPTGKVGIVSQNPPLLYPRSATEYCVYSLHFTGLSFDIFNLCVWMPSTT